MGCLRKASQNRTLCIGLHRISRSLRGRKAAVEYFRQRELEDRTCRNEWCLQSEELNVAEADDMWLGMEQRAREEIR